MGDFFVGGWDVFRVIDCIKVCVFGFDLNRFKIIDNGCVFLDFVVDFVCLKGEILIVDMVSVLSDKSGFIGICVYFVIFFKWMIEYVYFVV